MNLVIVESPSKCSKIQGFLGDGWKVLASMGHIRQLVADVKALHIEKGFEPEYEFSSEKSKTIADLRAAAKGAKVYLASDDDREGEAISYSVALALKLDVVTNPRVVFHEITKTAVLKGIADARTINMNRVNSQQARAVLDMMVGFTISPLLWKFVGSALSAGRCQTPALRIIVEREQEIKNFSNSFFWKIRGNWTEGKSNFNGIMLDDLEDEESTLNYLENVHNELCATISSVETKPTSSNPPLPLITSTLQQEASALFNANPKATMMAAQKLYEAGHITYMRTDSTIMCEEAIAQARAQVKEVYGEEYLKTESAFQKVKKKDDKEVKIKVQEAHEDLSKNKSKVLPPKSEILAAHEAIRPTHFEITEVSSDLEKKIYTLIYKRAIQSVMATSKGEERKVQWRIDNDDFVHEGVWKRITFQGWKIVGASETDLDEKEEEERQSWNSSESLKKDAKITWCSLTAEQKETKPLPRYNEATLVRELEKKGIGRPSTFASLVGAITEKEYVVNGSEQKKEFKILRYILNPSCWPPKKHEETKKSTSEKSKMMPTDLGIRVHEFCMREFPNLFDYDFTKHMETRLDLVEGGADWKKVCIDTYDTYKTQYETLKAKPSSEVANSKKVVLSNGYEAVLTKKGPFIIKEKQFLGWPSHVTFPNITDADVEEFLKTNQPIVFGYHEEKPLIRKSGKFGEYIVYDGKNIPLASNDTVETLIAKTMKAPTQTLGEFRFGKGAYGAYMMKKEAPAKGKKPIFVSIPADLDISMLTEEAAKRIYQNGLSSKNKKYVK